MSLQFDITPEIPIQDELTDVMHPTNPKGKFNIWARYYIITYRTHLSKTDVTAYFTTQFDCKIVRVAHETSTKQVKYEHTHVFLDFGKSFKSQNCRIFDLVTNHPNIGPIAKRKHLDRVYKYMCKQDHSNDDMLTWIEKTGVCVQDIWEHSNLSDAVKHADKVSDVPGIIAAYNLKPRPEFKIDDWEFEWQYELERRMTTTNQPRRQIWWYCDNKGGMGKTDFAKGMIKRYPKDTYVFTQFGGAKDAATIVVNAINSGWTGRYCVIDLPRDAETKSIYEPMEMIRNGMITSIKYQGSTVLFDCTWVIVFANFNPEYGHMSADRWVVYQMNDIPKFKLRCTEVARVLGESPAQSPVFTCATPLTPPTDAPTHTPTHTPDQIPEIISLNDKMKRLNDLAEDEYKLRSTTRRLNQEVW